MRDYEQKRFVIAVQEIDNGYVGEIAFDGLNYACQCDPEVKFYSNSRETLVLKLSDEAKRLVLESF